MSTVHDLDLVLVVESDHAMVRARSDAVINFNPPALRHTAHDDLTLFLKYLKGHDRHATGD
jgi:hypothetical protein